MWGSRESQQHAGLCQLNTARSWRKAMTALSSDTGITWGGKFSRKTEPAKPGSSHRRIDGEIEMVQSRHKENIFHSEDKKISQQGPRNTIPSLEASGPSWTKPWTACCDSSVDPALSPGWPASFLPTWLKHLICISFTREIVSNLRVSRPSLFGQQTNSYW